METTLNILYTILIISIVIGLITLLIYYGRKQVLLEEEYLYFSYNRRDYRLVKFGIKDGKSVVVLRELYNYNHNLDLLVIDEDIFRKKFKSFKEIKINEINKT